ncbi:MAG: glycosyltransferase family 4 protein, partial [Candidatus Omnitrophica bacterium]|nr:glycosyltransferase family 4 protein [Candidatus Omnitrophota bacterium]
IREKLRAEVRFIPLPIRTKSELSPALPVSLFFLVAALWRTPVDVVHAQTRVTQVLAFLFTRIRRIPFVTTCHGFFRANIGRRIWPCWGERVIAISDAVRKHLLQDFRVPAKKVVFIPNGIDVDQFAVALKTRDPQHRDRIVGIVARLSSVKGHRYLLQAMPAVLRVFPDAQLYIFGEGSMKFELVHLAEKLRIQERVFFLPNVSNTPDILPEIDIFVMPSIQEGLGLSLLEAQACGLPVVASDVGGIPTVVKHEVTGLLAPPRDPQALAAAIIRLMSDRELAMRLGERARKDVAEKFTVARMTAQVEKVYREVLRA